MFLITALLIGTLLETLTYGSYVLLCIKHFQILAARRNKIPYKPFCFLVIVSFGFFVITTVTVVSDLTFMSNIFTNYPNTTINLSGYARKDGINEFSQILSIMLSDLFLLYRCYVLYSTQLRLVVFPFITFAAEVGFGIWAMVSFKGIDIKEVDPWSNRPLERLSLGETIFGFDAFATNILCTSLIVFRLWRTHHELVQFDVQTSRSSGTLFRIGFVILNSAAIYIVWMIAVFSTSVTSSLVYQIITPSFSCITALIFSSIIVRAPASTPTTVTEMTTISFSHPPVPSTASDSVSGSNARKLVFAQRSRDESDTSLSSRQGPQGQRDSSQEMA
ncbi:hypothetical protein GGU10DRAFT_358658 [Lentinula aff. detonsa]|uniref:Uncharacterized protein n=1 Tax=Lentinula aff. detonsa TaxID=2804958 RepID=A0AA38KFI8_9AGAR|nr:hypothetical protein GGU10DRAFT_358658 [Lentinula aff. detonsa]